jgi:hypothetical protein
MHCDVDTHVALNLRAGALHDRAGFETAHPGTLFLDVR